MLGLGLAACWQREGIKRGDANPLAQLARNDAGDRGHETWPRLFWKRRASQMVMTEPQPALPRRRCRYT